MSIIGRLCEECGERHSRCQKVEITSAQERATTAEAALERERTLVARYARKVRLAFQSRDWIMEGRGSYPHDDDRYREEVRHLYDDAYPNLDALQKIGSDLTNCPKTQEAVEAARAAAPIEPPPPRCGEESAQAHEMLEEMRRSNPAPQRLEEPHYLGVSAKRWSEIHGNAYALLGLALGHVTGTLRDTISAYLNDPTAPLPTPALAPPDAARCRLCEGTGWKLIGHSTSRGGEREVPCSCPLGKQHKTPPDEARGEAGDA